VHKLIVHGERSRNFRTKANKDLLQAAALIGHLAANRPDELRSAWRDACSRGEGWRTRARKARPAGARPRLAERRAKAKGRKRSAA
jgi:hypothetical protein